MQKQLRITGLGVPHNEGKPILIAGPCSAEGEEQVLETAAQLSRIGCKIFRAGVWKPRTKPGGFEGYGEKALVWLKAVKEQSNMLVATEVATPKHVELALSYGVDILWVGARTSSSPFAMQELAGALRGVDVPVLVKNPVCPDLGLWIGAMERLSQSGVTKIAAVHRGFPLYGEQIYRNAPIWQIPIELRRCIPNLPIFIDPSHMGGQRDLVQSLCQQAMELCYDGLMIESHCSPDDALTDAAQQVSPMSLGHILSELNIRNNKIKDDELSEYRAQINEADERIVKMLANRMGVCRKVAKYKSEHDMSVLQAKRYDELLRKWEEWADVYGLSYDFTQRLFGLIHEESVNEQMKILNRAFQKKLSI